MFISLAAFTVYGAMGYQLTAAIAFPALSLFNLLRFPLMMLPEQILNLIQVSRPISENLYIGLYNTS